MSQSKEILRIKEDLQDLLNIQCADGNWDHDAYMFGMANGLILAMSVVTGEDPDFLAAPENFLADFELIDKFNKSSIIVNTDDSE